MSGEIQQTLEAFSKTAVQLEALTRSLNIQVAPVLAAALTQARTTLKNADGTLVTAREAIEPKSTLQQELNSMLRELTAAARSIRVMADYLERHPEALIQGKRARSR